MKIVQNNDNWYKKSVQKLSPVIAIASLQTFLQNPCKS